MRIACTKVFLAPLKLIFLVSMLTLSPHSFAQIKFNNILYGVSYYHEYMPSERLEKDVQMMQDAGVSVVRLAESSWSGFEPQEGKFEFAWMDRIINRLHKAGVKVIVGTPTYSIPPWLWKKHPDMLIEYADGRKLGYGIRQNVDITNPTFLVYAERIVRKIAEHYAKHPAVIGFQVDNETLTRGAANPGFQKGFLDFVKGKFGTTQTLNKIWGLNYWGMAMDNWDEFPDRNSVTNTGYKLEWERYKMKVIADYLTWQTKIVDEYKRPDQFVTHCFMTTPEIDKWATSRSMDILGLNKYPPTQDKCSGAEYAMAGDYIRSVKNSNYLVTETTGQTTGWDSKDQHPPYDGQLRLNVYSNIGSGANMVEYWHWHSIHYGQETYWKGILSHDLEPNRVYEEMKKTALELKKFGPRLVNLKIKPQVAILFSYDANHALNIMPYKEGSNAYRSQTDQLHRVLYNNSVAVDFISADHVNFKDYKLVIIPPLYVASDSLLNAIADFVKNGGQVVMMFKSGFTDQNSMVRPVVAPGPLRKACGFYYQEFANIDDLKLKDNPFAVADKDNTVSDWAELIIPETAHALAFYDHPFYGKYPAITSNKFGKGTLVYEGCRPSDALQEKILVSAMERAGIKTSDQDIHWPLIAKQGTNDYGKKVHFYYNYSPKTDSVTYNNPDGKELTTERKVKKGEKLSLEPWGVQIVEEN
ncbi:beta-galactosidase [Chitinophagaceae bacterium LB-8]|uniref:Beta-galactosidase n=1 Tax=Paraflavisolibacter caeni TaxID=2982496 RepID=A0A9X2XXA6_9BACT|nr:beta-galactosidase [Paraflavisolibacter caeni]MCU7550645.1 beta-galactosidase [Paraflavisolibacter caeni]